MLNQGMLSIAYGLASAVSWGTGDFVGGFAAKKSNVFGVLLVGHIASVVLLSVWAIGSGITPPSMFHLAMGALAGVTNVFGLAALFKGLATGQMGTVAPVAAVMTALVAVLFGMMIEGLPTNMQIAGFLFAFVAIWLLSMPKQSNRIEWRKLKLPMAAGVCLGLSLVLIDHAVEQTVVWPLLVARCMATVVLIATVLIIGSDSMPKRNKYPLFCLTGICDTLAYVFFGLAAQSGRLDISAVLGSMYPATTVLLAWLILKEGLSKKQWIGAVAAMAAIALIVS
jgi:drug/metabolite transporter (DMT)-like permease